MRPVGEPPSPARGPGPPTRLRMAGFAASATLAASAYGAGALPAGTADPASGSLPGGWSYWLGLAGWFLGLAALSGVWWRLGVRLRRQPASVPLGWLLRTGLLWAAPLLLAPPVGSRDVYAYACQGALWLDGVDPYAVGVQPGGCVWADAVPALWRDTETPYGPLAVALAGGAVALARLVDISTDGQLLVAVALLRAEALAGVVLAAGSLPRLARASGVDPVRAAWLGLVSPLVGVHALGGAHNDALVLGLVVAALALAASRPRFGPGVGAGPGIAVRPGIGVGVGALLGLAVAIKVTAIVGLPFAVLLCTARPRHVPDRPGRVTAGRTSAPAPDRTDQARPVGPAPAVLLDRRLVATAATVLAGAVLAFAGLSLATGLDLGWISALSGTGRLVQWTSIPTGLGMAAGYLLRLAGHPEAVHGAVAAARLLGLVALAGTLALLLVRAAREATTDASPDLPTTDRPRARRRLVAVTGLAFTALALLSPIFYPWYGLVAVTVLAAGLVDWHRVRRVAVAVIVLGFLVLPGGLGLAVLSKLPGALLDVALVAVLSAAAYRRWRSRSRSSSRR
ncbi:polyprenol phosphomannose-dependent alpha 1,6 mannosyltransferase MptB [Micromonospora sp. WMMD1102]|uniref:polyprenol phosphomannose-dependent alpha 1,6 mannosyltransferase MptB n=1 Tax=Micromonospora sp. WMMD1102 TaxID=3016105 RepID=UPI00241518D4|nr:polyprenol phosphomannose-dependent alpha 1,6 mannosyltransferase MptB [Micromonospora sp. WMMD1102]MDG4788815.1 polyprenol phosphomannose-dependent alpha 1,6 mannosyltransferase MptB [Micromonospora sp. WMMD1102]